MSLRIYLPLSSYSWQLGQFLPRSANSLVYASLSGPQPSISHGVSNLKNDSSAIGIPFVLLIGGVVEFLAGMLSSVIPYGHTVGTFRAEPHLESPLQLLQCV